MNMLLLFESEQSINNIDNTSQLLILVLNKIDSNTTIIQQNNKEIIFFSMLFKKNTAQMQIYY